MSIDKKIWTAALALSASLLVAGCNEEKSSSTADNKPAAADAVKDAATAAGEKVQEAAEAAKDAASVAVEKAGEAVEAAKEVAADVADKVEEKVAESTEAAKTEEAAKPAEEAAAPATEEAAPAAEATVPAEEAKTEAAAPAEETKTAEAPAATEASSEPAAASGGEAGPDNDQSNPDNKQIAEKAKSLGLAWSDGRWRDKDGHPAPVVTDDYKVDWATWQGFRRYHDACHVCHGPNAGGSTFAPSLADSLKTMDYETFFGVVVGGRVADRGGTKYVMPAFGEDKNIMCYLDDIYSYIKARSTGAMPPGRPAGREDISEQARKAGTECFGEDQTGGGSH